MINQPKLSILIPVFNEEKTVGELIRRVAAAPSLDYQKEIIVVDDGSNDGTEKILEGLKKKFVFILLKHPKNLGKGAAIKTGLKTVTGQLVLIQDADLEYDPLDYPVLLKSFKKGWLVVYGSRNLEKRSRGYFFYYLGAKFLTIFFNLMFKSRLTDIYTGYKLFRADVIKGFELESRGFSLCPEVTAKVLKIGWQIKEVPIHYYPRKFSQGKKITFWDGLEGLWTIIKYRGRGRKGIKPSFSVFVTLPVVCILAGYLNATFLFVTVLLH